MDIRSLLAEAPLFSDLDDQALDELASHTEVRAVASGQPLIEIGTPATHLYLVAVGRLRVARANGTVINDIGRLEPVGEMSLLEGDQRTAIVYAVRDTRVLAIRREALFKAFAEHPSALLSLSKMIISRLRVNQRSVALQARRKSRCFAILSASPEFKLTHLVGRLEHEMAKSETISVLRPEVVDRHVGAGSAQSELGGGDKAVSLIRWLEDQETRFGHLMYIASPRPDNWSLRCMRQADRVLVVVDATDTPRQSAMIDELRALGTRATIDLLIVRKAGANAGPVVDWRKLTGASAHYFVDPDSEEDIGRVARSLTGRACGLVLGSGGARGFEHIGLIRAMEELNIKIDVLGGSSMGAFICALASCGYDSRDIERITRDTFVDRNLLNDYLFPSVSLIRGRKFLRHMMGVFGNRKIEHQRVPYFCVSTNLSKGESMVHDRGPMSIWVCTSMCIPGVAPPVGYKGDLLCDGAVLNSLPTDIMQDLGRGPIIAADVSTEGGFGAPGVEGPDPETMLRKDSTGTRPNLFSILFRTATLTSESGAAARAARADLYLRMPVEDIGIFDWKKCDIAIERGYNYSMEHLPAFIEKMKNLDPHSDAPPETEDLLSPNKVEGQK